MLNQGHGDEVDTPSFRWPKRSYERRQRFQELYRLLYTQVLHGCGNPDCTTPSCATFRKKHSKRGFRPYTAPTARSIALHLASQEQPSQRLCVKKDQRGGPALTARGGSIWPKRDDTPSTHGNISANQCPNSGGREEHEQDGNRELQSLENEVMARHGAAFEQLAPGRKDSHSLIQQMFSSVSLKFAGQAGLPTLWHGADNDLRCQNENAGLDFAGDGHFKAPQTSNKANLAPEVGELRVKQAHVSEVTATEETIDHTVNDKVDGEPMDATLEHQLRPQTGNLLHRMPQSGRPLEWIPKTLSKNGRGVNVHETQDSFTRVLSQIHLGRTVFPELLHYSRTPRQRDELQHIPEAYGRFLDLMGSIEDLLMSFTKRIDDLAELNVVFSTSFVQMISNLKIPSEYEFLEMEIFSGLWQNCLRILPAKTTRTVSSAGLMEDHWVLTRSGLCEDTDQQVHEMAHFCKICMAALAAHLNVKTSWQVYLGLVAAREFQKFGWRTERELEPNHPSDVPYIVGMRTGVADEYMRKLENEICQSITDRICIALASQKHVYEVAVKSAKRSAGVPVALELFVRGLADDLAVYFTPKPLFSQVDPIWLGANHPEDGTASFDWKFRIALEHLIEWFRNVIVRWWNGKMDIVKCSPLGGALDILASIYTHYGDRFVESKIFEMPYIYRRLDIIELPTEWIKQPIMQDTCHLLDYPFLFPPSLMVSYFRAINHSSMKQAHKKALAVQTLANRLTYGRGPSQPGQLGLGERLSIQTDSYLVLEIRRSHVLSDAFDQVWRRRKQDLLRPLRVLLGHGEGEEGADHGGVQLEFFRLAFAEAMDPMYGVFSTDPVTHMSWFKPGSLEPLYKFELLGLLVSLAMYNGLTLPLTFPLALYMKLLNHEPDHLEDVEDGWPDLAKGLRDLLEWDGDDVEDVFCREYTFSVETFGTIHDTDMTIQYIYGVPYRTSSSSDTPMVTSANRHQYVRDYIRHLTNVSIAPQFEAFAKGFKSVVEPKSLSLFTPRTLQTLIEGVPQIDTKKLEAITRYEDGYSAAHPVIRNFWSVVHGWTALQSTDPPPSLGSPTHFQRHEGANNAGQETVRQLLEFVTASDRLPVGGESRMLFTIQMAGGDDDQLPRSMTCFGRLLLPAYSSKAVLRERLEKAIEYAKGFGTS